MATLDLPMLVEDPLLMRCDSGLWGEADLLSILNCDLALDEEFPLLAGLQELAPPPPAPAAQQPLAPAPPPPAPLSPQTSIGSGSAGPHACIYVPNAVCKGPSRRSASPSLSGNTHGAPNLPALQGSAWRTVTTAPASTSHTTNAAPPAPPPAPYSHSSLPRMPSSATSGACGPASSSEGGAAPPAAKVARTSAGSRSRRAPANSKPAARKLAAEVEVSEDETDSEDSNDTEEHMMDDAVDASGQPTKSNKRKAPEIDWRSIEDPAERRRQRRLAKNRVTAARSRERKKSQWAEMEEKLSAMEAENRSLRQMLESISKDNEGLRAQLAAALGGSAPAAAAAGARSAGKGGKHTHEPAVLVLIVTLLLCAFLPSSGPGQQQRQQQRAAAPSPAALGGALLLAELLLRLSTKSSYDNWSSKPKDSLNGTDFEPTDMLIDDDASPHGTVAHAAHHQLGLLAVKPEPGMGLGPSMTPLHTSPPPGRPAATAATSLLHALLLCVLAALKSGLRTAKGLPPLLVRSVWQAVKAGAPVLRSLRQHAHRLAGPSVACVM